MAEKSKKYSVNMKVSIIVPIYNVSDYIERCLQSVLNQTFTDFECLMIDDCTPDDSIEKCERLITEYNGPIAFKILHHEHNRGLSAARNTGTYAAQGDYIYYLDSDDYISSDCLAVLLAEVEKYPNTEMICGRAEPEDKVYATNEYVQLLDNNAIRLRYLSQEQEFPIPAWNKLIRRDFILHHNLFFKEGLIHEDVLWTFHVIQKLNTVSLLPQTTYHYFQREQSIVYATPDERRANSMMGILREIAETADEPFRLLTLYKFLLRVFDWYRITTIPNRKTIYAFSKALLQKRKYQPALTCLIYLMTCHPKHGRRIERVIKDMILQLYVQEQNQQIKYRNGFN